MSARTRREFTKLAAKAQTVKRLKQGIRYHATCESAHLASARDATDPSTRASHNAHAGYHRTAAYQLEVQLKEVEAK